MPDVPYWAALYSLPGIGPRRFRRVIEAFGGARGAWRAGGPAIAAAAGLVGEGAGALEAAWRAVDPDRLWQQVRDAGFSVLIRGRPGYPSPLAAIADAPEVLYCAGRWTEADARALAVVGSRRADQCGLLAAERVAGDLAAAGVTVVSGLARGVDAAAHRAALAAGGRTIAVLGSGPDRIYPAEHRRLAERVAERGAVLSEFAPGTPPRPWHFPWRNRIVAGLAQAVVVVQAGRRSGALITVDWALDQGKEVFACPADLVRETGAGNIKLLEEGARLALSARDILDQLGWPARPAAGGVVDDFPAGRAKCQGPLADIQEQVYALLSAEPRRVDDLVASSGLTVGEVSAALTLLELRGLVRRLPGPVFVQGSGQGV